ncbi:SRPBCC family protein [Polaribacter sp. MED152]|uniref:SRPBCC family protein n=1 Tax=Polaribacter sp. MED152 TaxID=313598 RepID=UPI000068CAED|nr:SRPBCC family protein [Polaribacter sp. MED152]EAQ42433.1 hypothetical protein MED152_06925 [Polaribacter sp. MED152]
MKNLIKTITVTALLIIGSLNATAQNNKADLSYVSTVELSADSVWEQIRIMDNIDKLSSFVGEVEWTGPKGVGGSRLCIAPDGQGKFRENIVEFDDEQRTYTWQIVEGVPAKVKNSFKVVDLGLNKSMIVWTSDYDFIENPNMTEEQFKEFMKSAITELVENIVKMAS